MRILIFCFFSTILFCTAESQAKNTVSISAISDEGTGDRHQRFYDVGTVIRMALAEHPSLIASQARVKSFETSERIAKAGYLPTLTLSNGRTLLGGENESRDRFRVSLEQPIYTFGKLSRQVDIAALNKMAADLDLYRETSDLAYNVAKAYIFVQQFRLLKDRAEKQLRGFEAIRVLARDKVAAGASPESDLTEADSRVAMAASTLHSYRAEFIHWSSELSGLTVRMVSPGDISHGLTHSFSNSCESVVFEESVNVKKAKLEILLKEKEYELAKDSLYPTLSLIASYEHGSRRNWDNENNKSVSLNLSVPINIGDFYKIDKASYEIRQKEYTVNEIMLKEEADFRTSKMQLPSYQDLLATASNRVKSSSRTRDIYREQYLRLGSRTLLDFLNAEGDIHQANVDVITSLSKIQQLNLECKYLSSKLISTN